MCMNDLLVRCWHLHVVWRLKGLCSICLSWVIDDEMLLTHNQTFSCHPCLIWYVLGLPDISIGCPIPLSLGITFIFPDWQSMFDVLSILSPQQWIGVINRCSRIGHNTSIQTWPQQWNKTYLIDLSHRPQKHVLVIYGWFCSALDDVQTDYTRHI